jgi:hypothetical protein
MCPAVRWVCALLTGCFSPAVATAQVTTTTWNGATGNWTNPGLWDNGVPLNGVPFGSLWEAVVSGTGALTLDKAVAVQRLTFGDGTIGGSNILTIDDRLTWTGGTFGPGADVRASGGATLTGTTGTGTMRLDAATLTLGGSSIWSGGKIFLQNGSALTVAPGGTLVANGNYVIDRGVGTAGFVVATGGVFRKQGGTGTTSVNVPLANAGSVEVNTGSLQVAGGGVGAGAFAVAAGSILQFTDGFTFDPGASVTGDGAVEFSGGTSTIGPGVTYAPAGGTSVHGGAWNVYSPISLPPRGNLPSLGIYGGSLGGTAPVTVNGPLAWEGGSLTGSGLVSVSGFTLMEQPNGRALAGRSLTLTGGGVWYGGTISVDNGSVLTIPAGATFWAAANNGTIGRGSGVGTAGLVVAGTFRRSSVQPFWTTTIAVPLTNTGTVSVSEGGTLVVAGGGPGGGTFTLDLGTTLEFANGSYTAAAIVNNPNGGGTVRVWPGAVLTADLTYGLAGTLTGTGIVNGTVTVNLAGTLAPGPVAGVGTLTVGGPVNLAAESRFRVKLTAGNGPAAPGTGGTSNNAAPVPPTTNDFLSVTAGALNIDPGTVFIVDGTGVPFVPGQSYSYRVAQAPGQNLSGLTIDDPSQFLTVGFTPTSLWISGDVGGTVYLNLVTTPVPEPGLLLAAAAAGLGGVRVWRRRAKATP